MSYFPEQAANAAAPPREATTLTFRQKAAAFWLKVLFWATAHAPWLARLTVEFWVWAGWLCSPAMRRNTMANARHVLGSDALSRQVRKLSRSIIRSSFLFVYDVGRHSRMSLQQMRAEVTAIEGQQHYDDARALKRGIIVATAHFGAFEGAVAALRDREQLVHVIFQRDRFSQFDIIRSQLHERLGINETPIDDGIRSWMRIREALLRDEAVLIQSDRVMPGQRGMLLPFFDGHIEFPIGPAKLAMLTGAPIVPVFAVRNGDGSLAIEIQPAIQVDSSTGGNPLEQTTIQIARAIEGMIRRHPQQWLMLHQPWCVVQTTIEKAMAGEKKNDRLPQGEMISTS